MSAMRSLIKFGNQSLRIAVTAGALVFGVQGAQAVTTTYSLDFTGSNGSGSYAEDGFAVDDLRSVSGNCDAASGAACMALNKNDSSTITYAAGGTFDLNSFWFEIFGGQSGSTLQLTSNTGGILDFVLAPNVYDNKKGQIITVVDALFKGITSLTFSGLVDGNIRVDDIGLARDVAAVPVPAGLPLLAAGIGMLGLLAWRRKGLVRTPGQLGSGPIKLLS